MNSNDRVLRPTGAEWDRCEAALAEFEESWRAGERPSLEEFLKVIDDGSRLYALCELVKLELEYRSRRGDVVRVEEYSARFPELAAVAGAWRELIATELRVRGQLGQAVTDSEIERRFPGLAKERLKSSRREDDSSSSARFEAGQRLGRYELREVLGRGGFATVYRAWDSELCREVAIKVPRAEFASHEELLGRVLREVQSAARLHHPSIVPIFEIGHAGQTTFIVYEFISGPTLAEQLRSQLPTPTQAAEWIAELAEALHYAHQCGVVHRDVKPANVLMACNPRRQRGANAIEHDGLPIALADASGYLARRPMLSDFGLASHSDAATTLTREGDILGTPVYMPPEQARGLGHQADPRNDVYSLGVVLYELLCGVLPFDGSGVSVLHRVIHDEPVALRSRRAGVPNDLETICQKAMAKEPERRYSTAGEFADDLHRFLRDEPILARRVGVAGRAVRWCRRNPALAGTIVVAGLLLAVIGGESYRRVLVERNRFLSERQTAVANLYDSLVREAQAIRLVRSTGFRAVAWDRLQQALRLETPARDVETLRREAAACLGDFVGHEPTVWPRPQGLDGWISAVAISPTARTHVRENVVDSSVGDSINSPRSGERGYGLVAVAFTDVIQLRDLESGRVVAEFRDHKAPVFALTFSGDGRTLATMDDAGAIKVRRLSGSTLAAGPNVEPVARSESSKGVEDEHALRKASERAIHHGELPAASAVPLREVDSSWSVVREIQGLVGVERQQVVAVSCALSPDGHKLFACSKGEQRVRQWDVESGNVDFEFRGPQHEPFVRAALSADGTMLVGAYRTAEVDGVVIWNVARREIVKTLPVTRQTIVDVAFNTDEKFLACACTEGTYVFDTTDWRQRTTVRSEDQFFTVAFHPDRSLLAVPSQGTQTIRLWDVVANREVATLAHPGGPHSVTFSPDGSRLITASADSVRVWNLLGSGEKRELSAHQGVVNQVKFSPDGRLLVSAGADALVRLWDCSTWKPLSQFSTSPTLLGKVRRVAFSPDGRRLAAVDWAGAAAVFDIRSPAEPTRVQTLLSHERQEFGQILWDVAFSPDGEQLAVAAQNGVWLWRGEQRVAVVTDKTAIELAFTPDGRTLLWREQNHVHRWNLETSREDAPPLAISSTRALFGDHELLHVIGRTESDGSPILQTTDLRLGASTRWTWSSVPRFVRELGLGNNVIVASDQSACILQGREFTLWDLRAKRLQCVLPAEANPSQTFDLSPDRSQLAIGLTDGSISVWNLPIVRQQLDSLGLGWE